MNNHAQAKTLFHTEVMQGIYQISGTTPEPTAVYKSRAPGTPTCNSYLVVGETEALLFDLAVDEPELKEYAEALAGKPVQLVLSHGHYDHTYHLNRFESVQMHPDDGTLLREGMPLLNILPVLPCPVIVPLLGGDTIDLGNRRLEVLSIPGHTPGSILLLDRFTGTLLSGDSCARRLLYLSNTPLEEFCGSLRSLQALPFDVIYSAHDRCALPKAYLNTMITGISERLPYSETSAEFPGLGKIIYVNLKPANKSRPSADGV